MNLIVSFINGREKSFRVDDYDFDEDIGYLKIFRDDSEIGRIAINQIVYWFEED